VKSKQTLPECSDGTGKGQAFPFHRVKQERRNNRSLSQSLEDTQNTLVRSFFYGLDELKLDSFCPL
jgi:hypothetical protein